jgi:mono/diheme cytochrome c family protein
MLKCERQTADGRRQTAGERPARLKATCLRRSVSCLLLSASCLLVTGCRRDMQDQPKAKPYRSSSFFKDGLSSRPLVEGTVPRGWLRADTEFFTGKKNRTQGSTAPTGAQGAPSSGTNTSGTTTASQTAAAAYPDDTDKFPFAITPDVLVRGRERFQIFCSVCHGMTGNGDGMVFRRGFRLPAPASFHQERLRQAPVGHFFDVVTNGWGAMPSYASQIPAQDRWAIIAYIRALQLSQQGVSPSATQSSTPAATATPAAKSGGKQ